MAPLSGDKQKGLFPTRKQDILKPRENQVPLKSRKLTADDKNKQLVNKIFKFAKEPDKQKPESSKPIVEEDPYGLPLLKSYKKKPSYRPQKKKEKQPLKTNPKQQQKT